MTNETLETQLKNLLSLLEEIDGEYTEPLISKKH